MTDPSTPGATPDDPGSPGSHGSAPADPTGPVGQPPVGQPPTGAPPSAPGPGAGYPPAPPPAGYGQPAPHPAPPGAAPGWGVPHQPGPYGWAGMPVDPVTGLPYSDKTRTAAGLLQLLLGALVCVGGVGRLYAGHTTIGVLQVVLSVVAWISVICAGWILIGFIPFFGAWLWFTIDGILMLAGRPTDGHGRLLR